MTQRLSLLVIRLLSILVGFLAEFVRFGRGLLRPRASLVAENLFLKKQLAFYRERNVAPSRLTDTAKLSLLLWSRWFDWRNALMVVKPETLIGWHRRAFQIFWRWKSQGGRPRLPKNLRALIAEMVWQNPTWGQASRGIGAGSEARDSCIATDGAGLLAGNSPTKPRSLFPTLGKLRTKPRQSHCGLRFRGRGDAPVSSALCVCGHGNREPQALACKRDAPPHVVVDRTATPRSNS